MKRIIISVIVFLGILEACGQAANSAPNQVVIVNADNNGKTVREQLTEQGWTLLGVVTLYYYDNDRGALNTANHYSGASVWVKNVGNTAIYTLCTTPLHYTIESIFQAPVTKTTFSGKEVYGSVISFNAKTIIGGVEYYLNI